MNNMIGETFKMARWVNKMRWLIGGMAAIATTGISTSAHAQDGAFTELYGYGVHRYYAGDYNEAQRVLNIVIEAGIEDPRPHYFRGLVAYQQGMEDAAKTDFEHAAELEARGKAVVNVSQALQRIQGPVRCDIELARLMARVAVAQEQRAKKQLDAANAQANPNIAKPPAGNAMPPAISGDAPAAPAAPNTPPAPPKDTVAPPPPDAQNDPFKDDSAVPAPTAPAAPAADPFGSAPAEPAAPAAPGTAPADDPFK